MSEEMKLSKQGEVIYRCLDCGRFFSGGHTQCDLAPDPANPDRTVNEGDDVPVIKHVSSTPGYLLTDVK